MLKYEHGKCPKISYTEVSDKMAYANPDQTAPWSSLIRVYTVCHTNKNFKKQLRKESKI